MNPVDVIEDIAVKDFAAKDFGVKDFTVKDIAVSALIVHEETSAGKVKIGEKKKKKRKITYLKSGGVTTNCQKTKFRI